MPAVRCRSGVFCGEIRRNKRRAPCSFFSSPLPYALLYIRQENQYRFKAATALKITLTLTLAVCLIVVPERYDSAGG